MDDPAPDCAATSAGLGCNGADSRNSAKQPKKRLYAVCRCSGTRLDDLQVYTAVSKCTLFRIETDTRSVKSDFVLLKAVSPLRTLQILPDKTVALL